MATGTGTITYGGPAQAASYIYDVLDSANAVVAHQTGSVTGNGGPATVTFNNLTGTGPYRLRSSGLDSAGAVVGTPVISPPASIVTLGNLPTVVTFVLAS